ncbi:MAG: DUF3990 domain-containing protein [Treponema sp.]|nr:DUF3990 domain-containing protein [Treponema sp.]
MIIKNGISLYHGSYAKIEKINLDNCLDGKDFGAGFYLATDYSQAVKFIKTSIAKAVKNRIIKADTDAGYVTEFKFMKACDVNVYDFKKAGKEWLHYVAGNRKKGIFEEEIRKLQKYDIICGKIANDATNRVITAYINNAYGKAGSPLADRTAINLLIPNKLSGQVCFKTQKSISCLAFVRAEEIVL